MKSNIVSFEIIVHNLIGFSIPLVEIDFSTMPTCVGYDFDHRSRTKRYDRSPILFEEAMRRTAHLLDLGRSRDFISNTLFSTGMTADQHSITGEDRRRVLVERKKFLADPNFGWSLCKEEGQKTLRYLHDLCGVHFMDFLRRIIIDREGNRCAFTLFREGDGSWTWGICKLNCKRGKDSPAFIL